MRLFTRGRPRADSTRIHFFLINAKGHSGVNRTVIALANQLVETRDVAITSVIETLAPKPHYWIDPRVELDFLGEGRMVDPEDEERRARLVYEKVASLPSCIVVTTRPHLHSYAAEAAARNVVVVGQEHINFHTRMSRPVAERMRDIVHQVDALVLLTEADAVDYRTAFPTATAEMLSIPNASPVGVHAATGLDSRVVVAGGRLARQKGYDRMIEAYRPLADSHPDWQLRIYGSGPDHAALQRQIDEVGAGDRIRLMGNTDDFTGVLDGAALLGMTSRWEGFPMVLLETMSRGVPPVAMDCPRGPGEIITDGLNGRLVPDDDLPAWTQAMAEAMDDSQARHRMSAAANQRAAEYDLATIGRSWTDLFDRLAIRHG